jgi:hypothetical protein
MGANQTKSYEFKAKTGYTNEPAIAVVLFTDTPGVTGLSSFNRRW